MSLYLRFSIIAASLGSLLASPAMAGDAAPGATQPTDAPARSQAAHGYPACTTKPTTEDVQGAKGAHQSAKAFYKKGKYLLAIQQWQLAYGFDCTAHRLLINIGNAHEKHGEFDQAIRALELYLHRDGKKADPTIRDRVEGIKKLLAKRNEADLPASAMAPLSDDDGPTDTSGSRDDNSETTSSGSIAPWLLIGGGSAAAIGGGVLIGVAMGKFAEADRLCPDLKPGSTDHACPQGQPNLTQANAVTNEGQIFNGAGIATLSVGVLAIGGGIWWYLTEPGADTTEDGVVSSYQLTPLVTPTFGGFGVYGRF